ncbi:Uncharacterized protein HZ326_16940 [Fusarium oxysporum f. sp. albedinis]|nr:Uncharacterized protein HZ326_16940 [Fusarium oxysporum f. sp. albedinis]
MVMAVALWLGPSVVTNKTLVPFPASSSASALTVRHFEATSCAVPVLNQMHLSYTAHLKGLQDITSQLSFVGLTSE